MGAPYLKDSLPPDKGKSEGDVLWAEEGEEPQLNCWMDVEGCGPSEDETVSYMYVNGAFLRDHLFIDFVEGGHHYRYSWVPESQIWIEDIMSVVDQLCTGVHEIHERYLMKYKGGNYEDSHDSACKIERILRDILLEKGTIIPTADDIEEIFAVEGRGESCEEIAGKLMVKEAEKIPGGEA